MTSSFREGGDIALWLHNKLGSTDDTWSSHTISGQLNPEVLRNIKKCFEALQPNVKVKILLSFLHLPRRQLDEPEWRKELNAIMETASHDTDQWVMMVADLMKTFPNYALFNLDEISDTAEEPFGDVLKELTKIVKKSTDRASLPLEFQFLGKQALATAAGHGLPGIQRHFTIKRKPKSATLRAELLQKSDATKKSLGLGGGVGIPGVKSRNFNEKKSVLDSSLIKKSGTGAFFKSPTRGPMGVPARGNLASRNQNIGIKVLDIKDQPLSFKDARKRKKDEEEKEKKDREAKKEKLMSPTTGADADSAATDGVQNGVKNGVAKPASNATAVPKTTPDYAASLGIASTLTPVSTAVVVSATASSTTSDAGGESHPPVLPDYAPNPSSIFPNSTSEQQQQPSPAKQTATAGLSVATSGGRSAVATTRQVQLQNITKQQQQQQQPSSAATLAQAQQIRDLQAKDVEFQRMQNAPAVNAVFDKAQQLENQAAEAKKGLSLTKEQMLEAQEMFKTSNKVTRPEKALILGFMAGSRDNPCPEKGHILTIRLSEREEMVQPDSTKPATLMHVETYFQMNYETGDWKRIKKCRPLPAIRAQSIGVSDAEKQQPQNQLGQQQLQQQQQQQSPSPTKGVTPPALSPIQRLTSPAAPIMYRAVAAPLLASNASIVRPGVSSLGAATIRTAAPTVRTAVTASSGTPQGGMHLIQAASVSSTTPAAATNAAAAAVIGKSAVAVPPAPYNSAQTSGGVSRLLASQSQIRASAVAASSSTSTPATTSTTLATSLAPGASNFVMTTPLPPGALRGGIPQGTVLLRAPDGRIVRANAAAFALGAQTLQVAPPQQQQSTSPRQAHPQQQQQQQQQQQAAQLRLVQQIRQEQQQQQQAQQNQQRQQQPASQQSQLRQQQQLSSQPRTQLPSLSSPPRQAAPPRLVPVSELASPRASQASGTPIVAAAAGVVRPSPAGTSSQIGQAPSDSNAALQNRSVTSGAPPLRFLVPGAGGGMVQLQQPLNAATIAALQRHQQLQLHQIQLAQQQQQQQLRQRQTAQAQPHNDKGKL